MRKRSYETKGMILAAARRLFFDMGYRDSSVDKIAIAAHTTKKTLYGYFANKSAILSEVINESIGVPWVFENPIEDMKTPEDLYRILVIIARGLNNVYSNPDYVAILRILISEVSLQPELTSLMSNGISKRAYDLLAPILIEAKDKKIIPIVNPEQRARSFVGGMLYDFYVDGLLMTYPGKVRRYTDLELFEYVSTCMPILVQRIVEKRL